MSGETKLPDVSVVEDDPSQVIVATEVVGAAPSEEEAPQEDTPQPEVVEAQAGWEFREDFGINNRMKEVIAITLSAANAERDVLLKKLEKLQYGSIKGR